MARGNVGLRTLIEQYQLEDVIEMPGFKPSHEVKAMLDDADVFLLPSITGTDGDMEGIPVALMEAMAVGIPVVSTVHSGIPETGGGRQIRLAGAGKRCAGAGGPTR
ncbi:glycosyl transferase family protein [Salmonella enterica subsp. enterica]|uniref:Glycosyl transferase family protein n=1 Tax=Salmonella enterica I TaxID=59201 RepID=A0A3S4HUW1_SALET|nr:glycosyl transferase family protein [Salmonella enterica subsp. enterica]